MKQPIAQAVRVVSVLSSIAAPLSTPAVLAVQGGGPALVEPSLFNRVVDANGKYIGIVNAITLHTTV